MSTGRPLVLTDERRAQLEHAMADGWSLKEIYRTLGINRAWMRQHYPEYNGWTYKQGAELGAFILHHGMKRDNVYT